MAINIVDIFLFKGCFIKRTRNYTKTESHMDTSNRMQIISDNIKNENKMCA